MGRWANYVPSTQKEAGSQPKNADSGGRQDIENNNRFVLNHFEPGGGSKVHQAEAGKSEDFRHSLESPNPFEPFEPFEPPPTVSTHRANEPSSLGHESPRFSGEEPGFPIAADEPGVCVETVPPGSKGSKGSKPPFEPLVAPDQQPCREHGCPGWAAGLARLDPNRPPLDVPAKRWRLFLEDARRLFSDGTIAQAVELGWGVHDLLGCDDRKPYTRVGMMGLVWLLHGNRIASMSSSAAVIEMRTGSRQTFRRKLHDPRQVLPWDLSGKRTP
jgi:hypothetical protein